MVGLSGIEKWIPWQQSTLARYIEGSPCFPGGAHRLGLALLHTFVVLSNIVGISEHLRAELGVLLAKAEVLFVLP